MTGTTVLFDAPGPRARRLSIALSIVSLVLIAAVVVWVGMLLAAPRESGGITLPGMFDPSRWNIFLDPQVWTSIGRGVVATLQAAAVHTAGADLRALLRAGFANGTPALRVSSHLRGVPVQ